MSLVEVDRQIVERLAREGTVALAELFTQLRPQLERIVAFRIDSRIQSRVDPADVLQEAYIQIAGRVDEYVADPAVSFFVWVRQKVIQVLLDIHRTHFRDKRTAEREVRFLAAGGDGATSMSMARYLLADITSPSGIAARAEEAEKLQQALESMAEIDREVLALRHFEQLSNQQVAEILGLSPTAASNRYVRAAARLSEILSCLKTTQNPVIP